MDNNTLSQIKEALNKNSSVAIAVGKNPGVDEMAAALSLYLAFLQNGKSVVVASASQPLVEHSSLVGIDKVKQDLGGSGGDLVVSFPYQEGEIEKVSYTLENGQLNIVVKSGEQGLSFSDKDVKFSHPSGSLGLLFIIGSPRITDLGSLFNPTDLKDTTVINLDNKKENQGFGDITVVSTRFSSVSEIAASLINLMNFKMDIDIAQNLMNGISAATDNFQSPETSAIAFEMVGILLRNGAQRGKPQQAPIVQNISEKQADDPFEALRKQIQQREQQMGQGQNQAQNQNRMQNNFPTQKPSQQFERQPGIGQVKIEDTEQKEDKNPPSDWLAPKIYKGSTDF
ncbi:hypothetical protein KKG52_00990 [Patescibacteria group bacterium]|nr:hypothetical protein [Patescibacteria group bacterium]